MDDFDWVTAAKTKRECLKIYKNTSAFVDFFDFVDYYIMVLQTTNDNPEYLPYLKLLKQGMIRFKTITDEEKVHAILAGW